MGAIDTFKGAAKADIDGLKRDVTQALANVTTTTELKATVVKAQTQLDALDIKVAEAGARTQSGLSHGIEGFLGAMKEDRDIQHLVSSHKGRARVEFGEKNLSTFLERKTITESGAGFATAGVLPQERESGIVFAARPTPHMRNVVPVVPTSAAQIMWVEESVRPTKASPVAEAGLKPLSDVTFTTHYESVRTIALLVKASTQILSDWSELEGFLRDEFSSRIREEEDRQVLFGDGSGQNLHGLTHQAQAWDLSLLTASDGYEYIDVLNGAQQQVAEDDELSERQFFVVNPGDLRKMKRTKDADGRYILGDPQSPTPNNLWGAPIVDTTIMTKGYFLLGSGDPRAAVIRERTGVAIDLSTEDGDNFQYNLVTVRFEERVVLIVKRPNAFVYGSFSQSPA
jgi:HK97 family phage major capsid protein